MGNGVSGVQQNSPIPSSVAGNGPYIVSRFHSSSFRSRTNQGGIGTEIQQDSPLMLMPNRAARRLLGTNSANLSPRQENNTQGNSAPATPDATTANAAFFPSPPKAPKPARRRYINYAKEVSSPVSTNTPRLLRKKKDGENNYVYGEEIGADEEEKYLESIRKGEYFSFYDDTDDDYVFGDELDEEEDDLVMTSAPADVMAANFKQMKRERLSTVRNTKLSGRDVNSHLGDGKARNASPAAGHEMQISVEDKQRQKNELFKDVPSKDNELSKDVQIRKYAAPDQMAMPSKVQEKFKERENLVNKTNKDSAQNTYRPRSRTLTVSNRGNVHGNDAQCFRPRSRTMEMQQSRRLLSKRYDQNNEVSKNMENVKYVNNAGDAEVVPSSRTRSKTVPNREDIYENNGQSSRPRSLTMEMQQSQKLLPKRLASEKLTKQQERNYFFSGNRDIFGVPKKLPQVLKSGRSASSGLNMDIAKLADDISKIL